jgi:hypothetical protein
MFVIMWINIFRVDYCCVQPAACNGMEYEVGGKSVFEHTH